MIRDFSLFLNPPTNQSPASSRDRALTRWFCTAALVLALGLLAARLGLPWYRHGAIKSHLESLGGRVDCRNPPGWLESVVGTRIAARLSNTIVAVDLDLTPSGDAELQMIASLGDLEFLSCNHTNLTDAGLQHINALCRLESLELVTDDISNSSPRLLQSLIHLRELTLPGRVLADDNILELRHLSGLQVLRIDGDTNLSLTGVELLKAYIPGLSIYW